MCFLFCIHIFSHLCPLVQLIYLWSALHKLKASVIVRGAKRCVILLLLSMSLTSAEVMAMLHELYSRFDSFTELLKVYKVETIGEQWGDCMTCTCMT